MNQQAVPKSETFLVTKIQRFSINDGPGMRTTIFLKGCPLHCAWCHNPECINPYDEFFHHANKCQRCGACAETCPEGAITLPEGKARDFFALAKCSSSSTDSDPTPKTCRDIRPAQIDRDKCTRCMKCIDACNYGAMERASNSMTVDQVLSEAESDIPFYKSSGGGITVSGGEPLLYPEVTRALMKGAKERGIHTALDTSGFARWETVKRVMEYVDIVLFDIKSIDEEKHIHWTGVSNRLILHNLRKMAKNGANIRLRLPIVHDVNYWDLQYPRKVLELARELGDSVSGIDIMPFHSWAERKYEELGRNYIFKGFPDMPKESLEGYRNILNDNNYLHWQITIGG